MSRYATSKAYGFKYVGRFGIKKIFGFRAWLFHIWCDYEHWHFGLKPDGIRIFGFEWDRWGK